MITDNLHPQLVSKVNRVLAAMAILELPMRICQGARTVEQQQGLYAQGRTVPGRIVTHADGVITRSNHQLQADGYGHAVDCCFAGSDPFLERDALAVVKWTAYGSAGKAIGLRWGGNFLSIVDRPHLELP